MDESILLWILALALTLGILVPYVRKHRKAERDAREKLQAAIKRGEVEPETLHPVVNPSICIGTGECVKVCPEKDVLGIISGQALPINQSHCVGHGLCERSCPVEAIQLVVGTSKRGVDIPRIRENFESNVPGVYVVGELGGMGLIKNAFEQARQCIDGIAREKARKSSTDVLDALIVGCGPAGLAASLNAQQKGLRFVTVEREDVGGTVRYYPRKKLVMTSPLTIPGYGKVSHREIQKEDLVGLWSKVIDQTGLADHVVTRNPFVNATLEKDGTFIAETQKSTYRTHRIILAVGRRGTPRKLGVPGEQSPHVMYSLLEPERFSNDQVLVVGGGDSAIEAALALAEQPGNMVHLSYRKARFSRLKPRNQERIEHAIQSAQITYWPESNATEIRPEGVSLAMDDGSSSDVTANYVFIFAGGTLATGLLTKLGVDIDTRFGEPLF